MTTPKSEAQSNSYYDVSSGSGVQGTQLPETAKSSVERLADWILHTPSYTQAELESKLLQLLKEARIDLAEQIYNLHVDGDDWQQVISDILMGEDNYAQLKAHTRGGRIV